MIGGKWTSSPFHYTSLTLWEIGEGLMIALKSTRIIERILFHPSFSIFLIGSIHKKNKSFVPFPWMDLMFLLISNWFSQRFYLTFHRQIEGDKRRINWRWCYLVQRLTHMWERSTDLSFFCLFHPILDRSWITHSILIYDGLKLECVIYQVVIFKYWLILSIVFSYCMFYLYNLYRPLWFFISLCGSYGRLRS